MKKISMKLLCEKGWCNYEGIPNRYIVSYCDKCKHQNGHRLIRFDDLDAVYVCTVCDGIRW